MLFELTVRQAYEEQEIINRFHYNSEGTPTGQTLSFLLTLAFGAIPAGEPPTYPTDAPLYGIRGMQATTLLYTEIEARAMYDVVDFYTRPFTDGLAGRRVGEVGMSPANAVGFRTNRVRTDIRRGMKRFAGVTEEYFTAGGALLPSSITDAENVAALLSEELNVVSGGVTITFTPVVLSFEPYTTPSGNTAYRPYATLAEQLNHMATGIVWSPYLNQRTQVSRQYGRGR